jgi:glycosyltransferase involved in cell wall biosynthesis
MRAKVAFCTVPHYGGIYSVYRRVRSAVADYGWDVRSVQVAGEERHWYGYDVALSGPEHTILPVKNPEIKHAARAFVSWVEQEKIDVVIPMSSKIALAALPHLPARTAVVTRCVDITPFTYRLVITCLARTDRIVVTSPRQQRDLVSQYRAPPDRIRHVPNAVDLRRFCSRGKVSANGFAPLRLVVLDRAEDRQKRIFMLPGIARRLDKKGIPFTLTVIGDGPDLESLRFRLTPWIDSGVVRCIGAIPVDAVPEILRQADVLLKTSRFEGFPSSLIEAMAAEVVPVVSHIAGVTDWIVRHGETGLLCPVDDENSFAEACAKLHQDAGRRLRMGEAAREDVQRRFGIDNFGERWASIFSEAVSNGVPTRPVRSWQDFHEPNLGPSPGRQFLLQWIPRGWKDNARARVERLRARWGGHLGDRA